MSRRVMRVVPWATVIADIALIYLAFGLAYIIRYQLQWFRDVDPAYYTTFVAYIPMVTLQTVLIMIAFGLEGVYRFQAWRHGRGRDLRRDQRGHYRLCDHGIHRLLLAAARLLSPDLSLRDGPHRRVADSGATGRAPRCLEVTCAAAALASNVY